MPAPRHFRLTMSGTLPGSEEFSCSLSLRPDGNEFMTIASGGLAALAASMLGASGQALFDDVVNDCTSFWGGAGTLINTNAVLKRVKLAALDDQGHYVAAPREAAVNQVGGSAAAPYPNQIARKVTLETNGDLGRIKGGFYLPGVTLSGYDATTTLFDTSVTGSIRDAVRTFLQDLENVSGPDWSGFAVVVASAGRHAKNGTLRVAPGLHDVTAVNVGRRPDVIRRRANKISEARITDAVV